MATSTAVPALAEPSPNDFWISVGIFPDALSAGDKLAEFQRKAKKSLLELGIGNLRLLCERATIPRAPKAGLDDLAGLVFGACPGNTLLHLREFLQRRVGAVEETFVSHFSEPQRKSLEAELINLGNTTEQMKVLTKLILLYRSKPESLCDIYYLKLSRSSPTSFEYEPDGKLPTDIPRLLTDKAGRLEHELHQMKKTFPVRFQGCHELPGGVIVVSVLRQYNPTVMPDFRPERVYNLHYGYGHIVFSINPARKRVAVRCKSSRIAQVIRDWIGEALGVDLRLSKSNVDSGYDPGEVVNRLLGGYPENAGVEIVGVKLRSNLPGQSVMTLEVARHQSSLREDLQALRASETIHARTVLDIEQMTISYQGQLARITTESTRGGLLRLCFDNTDWDQELEDGFHDAFEAVFHLPLDRSIDPTKLAMGQEGVFSYLLGIKSADQVQPFQKDSFDQLMSRGILATKREMVKECGQFGCEQKVITDLKREECPKCGTLMTRRPFTRVNRVQKAIRKCLAEVLNSATCTLGEEEHKFEGVKFFPLKYTDAAEQERTIAVLIRDTVPDSVKTKLERSSRALLFVRARTLDRAVYLDEAGVGQVNLAYLLAAQGDMGGLAEARGRCKDLLEKLQRDYSRRALQSGARSHQAMTDRLATSKDYEFETDVFNVLRSIFPETIKLGRQGKSEPDGFCGLPGFVDGSLRDGILWAWTYDAKLAESGAPYDLNSGEYRKMKDYIDKLRRANCLFHRTKRLKAHVLISNNIEPGRMKVAADYLRGPDGVKAENREVTLVFMQHTFLLRLYERVRDREDDFRRRGPFLAEGLAKLLSVPGADGYVLLTPASADQLAAEVLARDEVHPSVDEGSLLKELEKQT